MAAGRDGTSRRGLDVHDIALVIQVDPPTNADVYTHRSGRTGRAGKKGRNVIFVPPRARSRAEMLFRSARVKPRFEDVPTADDVAPRPVSASWLPWPRPRSTMPRRATSRSPGGADWPSCCSTAGTPATWWLRCSRGWTSQAPVRRATCSRTATRAPNARRGSVARHPAKGASVRLVPRGRPRARPPQGTSSLPSR
ncbi:MAG: hypothetical protein H6726_25980 [Sandaracinaceae bacterium]|nr:hypothetical protein [Sandaracinaceae bacterium]